MPGTVGCTSQSIGFSGEKVSMRGDVLRSPDGATASLRLLHPGPAAPFAMNTRHSLRMTCPRMVGPQRVGPTIRATGSHFSNNAATARMRLREYFGSPALIELPVLNELLPASTCAGTRLRR